LDEGTGKSLDLEVLNGSIGVVDTFTVGAGAGGQVSVGLELPVCPSDQLFVSDVSKLVDFLLAGSISEASTEFSDEKGNSESVSISCSSIDLGLMPLLAAVSVLWEWFLIFACLWVHGTAV